METQQRDLLHSLYAAGKLEHVDGISIQGIKPEELERAEAAHKLRAKDGYITLTGKCGVCPWFDHIHARDTFSKRLDATEELSKAHALLLQQTGGCKGTPDIDRL